MKSTLLFPMVALSLTFGCASAPPTIPAPPSISASDALPVLIKGGDPVYPEDLQKRGVRGTVVVEFIVDTSGVPRNVHPVSSPSVELSALAIGAVEKWRFEPGFKDGRDVNSRMQVPIIFDLEPAPKKKD